MPPTRKALCAGDCIDSRHESQNRCRGHTRHQRVTWCSVAGECVSQSATENRQFTAIYAVYLIYYAMYMCAAWTVLLNRCNRLVHLSIFVYFRWRPIISLEVSTLVWSSAISLCCLSYSCRTPSVNLWWFYYWSLLLRRSIFSMRKK